MDRLIYHNDRIVPFEEARLSPGQMGLLMGWGVFTTLRLYRGLPFAFERHWARMMRDAERVQVAIPQTLENVRRAVIEVGRVNHRPEAMARISFVKNAGGLWAEAEDLLPSDLLIFTREVVSWPAIHRLELQPMGIFSAGPYAGVKMLSWIPHAAVLEKAHAQGFDDALLMNEKGRLAECTSANIFVACAGRMLTPPLSSGCLAGVTREVLMEIAPGAGIDLREQELTTENLSSAEEVFVSSTTREVAAVGSISPDWNFQAPGKITVALEQAFQTYVKSYLDRALAEYS